MTTPAPAPATPEAELAAPIKAVHDVASGFSTDAWSWLHDNTQHALTVLAILISVIVLLQLLRRGLMRFLGGKEGRPKRLVTQVAYRLIRATSVLFVGLFGCWVVLQFIPLPRGVAGGLTLAFTIAGFIQVGFWAREILSLLVERRLIKQGILNTDSSTTNALGVIGWLINLGVWSIIFLLLLDNLGVNITALVAGLGIGGLAIGLAAQGIMADLFSALSIVFDKPFMRGDFIAFGDKRGTVEKVGLKTSRLRALTGEVIVVANNQLLTSVIHNHQQLLERRIVFTLALAYTTTPEQIEAVPGMIKDAIAQDERCRFDRAHFTGFGESALNFEVVYYYKGRDYNPYMDSNQAILLRIMRAFRAQNIRFAVPTRLIYTAPEEQAAAQPTP